MLLEFMRASKAKKKNHGKIKRMIDNVWTAMSKRVVLIFWLIIGLSAYAGAFRLYEEGSYRLKIDALKEASKN